MCRITKCLYFIFTPNKGIDLAVAHLSERMHDIAWKHLFNGTFNAFGASVQIMWSHKIQNSCEKQKIYNNNNEDWVIIAIGQSVALCIIIIAFEFIAECVSGEQACKSCAFSFYIGKALLWSPTTILLSCQFLLAIYLFLLLAELHTHKIWSQTQLILIELLLRE